MYSFLQKTKKERLEINLKFIKRSVKTWVNKKNKKNKKTVLNEKFHQFKLKYKKLKYENMELKEDEYEQLNLKAKT